MHRTFFFTDAESLKTEVLKFKNSSENFTHWKIALKTGRFSYRTKRPSVVTRIPSLQEGRNALPISNSDLECCDADAEMLACQRHCGGGCARRDIMYIALPYP